MSANGINSGIIPIQPHVIQKTASFVEIYSGQVIFNVGIIVTVNFMNEQRELLESRQISITGAEYDAWMYDNELIQSILNKVGVSAITS